MVVVIYHYAIRILAVSQCYWSGDQHSKSCICNEYFYAMKKTVWMFISSTIVINAVHKLHRIYCFSIHKLPRIYCSDVSKICSKKRALKLYSYKCWIGNIICYTLHITNYVIILSYFFRMSETTSSRYKQQTRIQRLSITLSQLLKMTQWIFLEQIR